MMGIVLQLLQLTDINESPVYLLLNPTINHAQKDLPISIFESGRYFYSWKQLCFVGWGNKKLSHLCGRVLHTVLVIFARN